jgi:hypothetical protein
MGLGRDSEPAILAGLLSGISGLAVFLVVHHAWIVPIWFVAPVGAVMAGLGGAAVGASYAALRPRLPPRPWTASAVLAVVVVTLTPAIVVGQVRGPIFALDANGGGTLLVPAADALVDVVVGLLGLSAVAGAVVGALIGRSRRAAATTMLAAVALAVGPGHNVPLLGGTPVVAKELAILGAVAIVSAVVLVEAEVRFARRRFDATPGPAVANGESRR